MNTPHLSKRDSSPTVERYSYNAETLGIEVKSLDFILEKLHLTARAHRADFYQLLWVSSGILRLQLDFQDVEVHVGEVLFIGLGQVCKYDVAASFPHSDDTASDCQSDNVQGISVLFSPEYLGEISADATLLRILASPLATHISSITPAVGSSFVTLLQMLLDEYAKPSYSLKNVVVQSYLRVLLAELATKRDGAMDRATTPLAQQFLDAVENHLSEWSNVSDFLEHLMVNEKVLSQAVRQATGFTPKVYIDQRRLLQAKRQLIYSALSSKEIGYDLGFDEPTNFHKFFRKHEGMTPQEFRQKYVDF